MFCTYNNHISSSTSILTDHYFQELYMSTVCYLTVQLPPVAGQTGADELINYQTEDVRERLKALTKGQGVDVIIDPVGGELFATVFRSIAWHGRMLVIGFASGDTPSLPANLPLLKGAAVIGVFWGAFAQRQPQDNLRNFQQLFA